jgi:aminopeptidase N
MLPGAVAAAVAAAVCVCAGPEWLSEMAAALCRQLRQLSAADSLAVVEAFSSWYAAGAATPDQQQQQQRDPQLQRLLGGLLVQAAAASATFKPQQLTHILGTLGLQMGFTAAEPSHESAVLQLLSELSHEHNLAALNTRQLVQLLQAIKALGVAPGEGFVAAVQHEGVKPRLTQLRAQEFADLAQALAGLRVLMEYEVLDGYWSELEGSLQKLTGVHELLETLEH